MIEIHDEAKADVVRGKESWNYLYIAIAFVLSIEGSIIQLLTSPLLLVLYLLVAATTIYCFIGPYKPFRNWLFKVKEQYEKRPD